MQITIHRTRTLFHRYRKLLLAIVVADFFVMLALYGRLLPFGIADSISRGSSQNIRLHLIRDFNWLDSLFRNQDLTVDLHLDDSVLGHTGRTVGHKNVARNGNSTALIAIGMGITSRGVADTSEGNIARSFQLFYTFLPSFCATTSVAYEYAFYLAYDHTDQAFSQPSFLKAFHTAFHERIKNNCTRGLNVSLHMVQCRHAGKPTWAQNDAMMEAYLDNVDYHYRINDDTVLQTNEWVEKYITTLSSYDPPNLGVVGPTHTGGNTGIMTYDFVHRTHVDVMGFYYPRLFTDWWGDDWVTRVYQPSRSTKLPTVRLAHTMNMGQRYSVRNYAVGQLLNVQLHKDIETVNRFVNSTRRNVSDTPDGSNIVSMSLFGTDPKYTWGAIRNAQLMPIYLPNWRLRIYILDPETVSAKQHPSLVVPDRIVTKLRQLGVDTVRVRIPPSEIPPQYWRYLVADDQSVNYFLIRDADSRISERDAVVVKEWIQLYEDNSQTEISVHCIRDHPKHAEKPIIDGLWGGNRQSLRKAFNYKSMKESLKYYYATKAAKLSQLSSEQLTNSSQNGTSESLEFLTDVVWPVVSTTSSCHDSVSCHDRLSSTKPIQLSRNRNEYLGQEYDAHNELTSADGLMVADLDNYGCRSVIETSTYTPTPTSVTSASTTIDKKTTGPSTVTHK